MRKLIVFGAPVLLAAVFVVVAFVAMPAEAQDSGAKAKIVGDPYTLQVCPITGKKVNPTKVVIHEGREIRFCCGNCPKKFKANPDKYLEKVDKLIIADQQKLYPLTTCPVSGKELGSGAKDVVWNNRLVKFCCGNCLAKAKKLTGDEQLVALIGDAAYKKGGFKVAKAKETKE